MRGGFNGAGDSQMRVASALATISLAVLVLSLRPARGQQKDVAQSLFRSANRERVARGLAPLKWSATLATAARQHALRMAAQNTLSHRLPGEPGMAERAAQPARVQFPRGKCGRGTGAE